MTTSTTSNPVLLPQELLHPDNRSTNSPLSSALPPRQPPPPAEGPSGEKWKGFAAGTLSGLSKLAIGHPFDTIKVRMQCSKPGTYSGPLQCLIETVKGEGPRALYKGASPPAVGWAISDSMLMGSLHQYRLLLASIETRSNSRDEGVVAGQTTSGTSKKGDEPALGLSLPGHFVSGMLAGWTVCFFITPIEHIKARLQMQFTGPKLYSGPIDCVKQLVKERGPLRGPYIGLAGTLLFRSWMGVMFLSYEIIQRGLNKYKPDLSPGTVNFLAGGMASNFFWVSAFPFDAIKNRVMTDNLKNPKYPTWRSAAKAIWLEGGPKAYYRGFLPCILRAFPTNASALFVWETTMRLLGAEELKAT
ncbi:uncharacterized protein JCM6883_006575 [Sporobolomyces salmoneus]|uniref:uncharacterized protein n=1 Tax=Sporobolomyces salmoneus TaxID=183962 RepID=UPI00317F4D82